MKNNMKEITSLLLALLLVASMSVTAFADSSMDAKSTDGNMSGSVTQEYVVSHKENYTDVSAVKLEWSVPVLKYVKTDMRTWNTETLKWEQSYDYSNSQEVTFTLTNRGSYTVKANVSYTSAVDGASSVTYGIKDPNDESKTINTNDPTLATIVNADHSLKVTKTESQSDKDYATAKSEYLTNYCTATISGTVSLDASKLSSGNGKLGTYTVSISKPAS